MCPINQKRFCFFSQIVSLKQEILCALKISVLGTIATIEQTGKNKYSFLILLKGVTSLLCLYTNIIF